MRTMSGLLEDRAKTLRRLAHQGKPLPPDDPLPVVFPMGTSGGLTLERVRFQGREWLECSFLGGVR